MLAASGLSPEFWGDALLTANYLRNLSAVANHNKTPYELWFGSVHDVSHLRIFGSKCYVVMDKSKRDGKFSHVSQEGIFLGYNGYSKNYRVLIDSKVTVHSREYVRFEENAAGPFHSDLPPLVDMVDDDEEVSADSETTSDSLDGHVDLPAENFSENVPAVSLAPLGNEFTIPLLDKLTLEMARDLGGTEAPREPEPFGTVSENKRPAGNQDMIEPGTCSTSGLSTRPCMDVPQVAAHFGVEDLVPGPQLEPVEFNFESAGIPHSPAGLFGGRYPERKRNTVLQPEINQTATFPTFCAYVQVQKGYPNC
jgi:hypothetical protein